MAAVIAPRIRLPKSPSLALECNPSLIASLRVCCVLLAQGLSMRACVLLAAAAAPAGVRRGTRRIGTPYEQPILASHHRPHQRQFRSALVDGRRRRDSITVQRESRSSPLCSKRLAFESKQKPARWTSDSPGVSISSAGSCYQVSVVASFSA